MAQIDELFSGNDAPRPRIKQIIGLLIATIVVTFFGLLCSILPALIPLLWAWNTLEVERDRVQTGFFPREFGPTLDKLRITTQVVGVIVLLSMTIQLLLLSIAIFDDSSFYHLLWTSALGIFGNFLGYFL